MSFKKPDGRAWRVVQNLDGIAVAAAVGVLIALPAAYAQVVANRYPELGFWHSVATHLATAAQWGLLTGAAVGAAIAILRSAFSIALAPLAAVAVFAGVATLTWAIADGWLTAAYGVALTLAGLTVAWHRTAPALGAAFGCAAAALASALLLEAAFAREFARSQTGLALLLGVAPAATAAVSYGLLRGVAQSGPWRGWHCAAAVALGAATVAAPWLLSPTLEPKQPLNLVLIAVDTLRADRSPPQKVARPLTPNLSRLASEGVAFRTAVSQAPWTMPAFASIVTGRYPHEHAAISLTGLLRPSELTLAEVLREAGYHTMGVVTHSYLDRRSGFAQGFEHFDDQQQGEDAVTSTGVSDAALELLAQPAAKPFFLFLHYFDPHYEFVDHAGSDYAKGYDGWVLRDAPDISVLRKRRDELAAADLQYLRDLYDEEIEFTDGEIGRVLGAIESRGLADDTLIVFVADHGEEFMERGWLGHTISLHEEVLRVPLVVRMPGTKRRGTVVEVPVETRALFGTVLDLLGIARERVARNASLANWITDTDAALPAADEQPIFSAVWLPDSPDPDKRVRLASVRRGPWKLIVDWDRRQERLYHLLDDPAELRDLAQERPQQRKALRALLQRWFAGESEDGHVPPPRRELDEAERKRLEALGYL